MYCHEIQTTICGLLNSANDRHYHFPPLCNCQNHLNCYCGCFDIAQRDIVVRGFAYFEGWSSTGNPIWKWVCDFDWPFFVSLLTARHQLGPEVQ